MAPTLATPEILCVVVTFNAGHYIEQCLAAAFEAGLEHLVIWDNASTDDTLERVAPFGGRLQIVASSTNVGFGRGVNAAIRQCSWNGHIFALNPDCIVTRETVESMIDAMSASARVGVVAPAMQYPDGRRAISAGAAPSLTKELLARTRLDDVLPGSLVYKLAALGGPRAQRRILPYLQSMTARDVRQFDWVSGFCMMVRDDAWRASGGFDERFFLYFEDAALCKSVRAAGWEVIGDGRTTALHDESASTRGRGKNRHYRAAMWTYFRYYGTPLERLAARVRSLL